MRFSLLFGAIILFSCILQAELNGDYIIILRYFSAPVSELEWEISIYQKDRKVYIQNKHYDNRFYVRQMDYHDYLAFDKKLEALHLDLLKSDDGNDYSLPRYDLYYIRKGIQKKIAVAVNRSDYGSMKREDIAVRLIKNYARLYNED